MDKEPRCDIRGEYSLTSQGTVCTRRLVIAETNALVASVGEFLILARDGKFSESIHQIGAIFYVDILLSLPLPVPLAHS